MRRSSAKWRRSGRVINDSQFDIQDDSRTKSATHFLVHPRVYRLICRLLCVAQEAEAYLKNAQFDQIPLENALIDLKLFALGTP